jgi:NAD(P)-dependent dehydrogenase (short-subunit alcohol dehydrogenase family)
MKDFRDRVAVITGGAGGIGRALAGALSAEGARLVLADVEGRALERAVSELERSGARAIGVVTDVSSRESVDALAERTFSEFGACHLLFNNAGVGAPSVNVWETTVNDWKWVHGVNVMGVVHGIQAFVPRMLAGGEEGVVVNTSSGDGGIEPLPGQSVYASSKAAVSILTECLAAQLVAQKTRLRAALFYPSGGLLDTGIWTCDRNRPAALAREVAFRGPVQDMAWFQSLAKKAGFELPVQSLDELAQHLLAGLRDGQFVIMIGRERAAETLRERAEKIGKGVLPVEAGGLFDVAS